MTEGTDVSGSFIASEHIQQITIALNALDVESVDNIFSLLREARDKRKTIFIAGNGGSSSTATHWANDLAKATKRSGQTPIKAISLSDNTAWITALANDEGYENIFSQQLDNFLEKGDLLVVISASGNSENLINAVRMAKNKSVLSVGLLGFDGGKLSSLVDSKIIISTDIGNYELVEDCHMALCHILTKCLVQDLFK